MKRAQQQREPRPVVSEWRQRIAEVTAPIKKWRDLSRIKAESHNHYARIKAAIEAMDLACGGGCDDDIAAAGKAEVEAWRVIAAFVKTIPTEEPSDPWADFEEREAQRGWRSSATGSSTTDHERRPAKPATEPRGPTRNAG